MSSQGQGFPGYNRPVPKVGDTIYVPSAAYLDHGRDGFGGGRATVHQVRAGVSGGKPTHYVTVAERPGYEYNWDYPARAQRRWGKECRAAAAQPDPDDDDEANAWAGPGDQVSGTAAGGRSWTRELGPDEHIA